MRRSLLFAVALGLASIPLQSFLFEKVTIVVPLAEWLVAHDLRQHLHAVVRVSDWAFWFCLFGVLLGVPLGLLARGHILGHWLIYWAAATSLSVLLQVWAGFGLGILRAELLIPAYWFNLLGVLCFAYLTAWAKARYAAPANVAP